MAELVDAHDSKSCEGNLLRVRFSPPAHEIKIPKSKRLGYFNFTVLRESKAGAKSLYERSELRRVRPGRQDFCEAKITGDRFSPLIFYI